MFKKHSVQLSIVKTPEAIPEAKEPTPRLTAEEMQLIKTVALFALGYMATKIVLNTACDLIIKYV